MARKTYIRFEVIRESEAPLDAHDLEATTAPMDGVLRDQVAQGDQKEAHVTKDKEADDRANREDWVHLMLHECHHFHHALLALNFLRAKNKVK